MRFSTRGRDPGAALFLTVFGLLTAAVPAIPVTTAPHPPLQPMTAADPDAFSLRWGGDRRTQARQLRRTVNPRGTRISVGSMLNTANRQAETEGDSHCRSKATAHDSALIGAHALAYYCLNDRDTANRRWTPQGVSGTEDARPGAGTVDGHKAIVFSWHSGPAGHDGTGTRLSFLDRTTNKYIHVLLVRPNSAGTDYSEVNTHAGGIVWYRHHLFVAGPRSGVRVFDTDNLLRLAHNRKGNVSPDCATGRHHGEYCGRGYHYLLPEIGRWNNQRAGTRYDSMSLERAPGRNPVFLTSEFRTTSVGRVARWADSDMTRFDGAIQPYRAWHQPVRYVQGAFSRSCYYFSTGGEHSGNRDLVRAGTPGDRTPASQRGGRGLQAPYWLRSENELWTLTEYPGARNRFIYGVRRPACP